MKLLGSWDKGLLKASIWRVRSELGKMDVSSKSFNAQEQYYERLKLFFLSAAFFCVIGSYSVIKEIKNTVFPKLVGVDHIPLARVCVMLALIPLIFLYSKMVDKLRRHHLLSVCAGFFALAGLVFAYFLGHPTIGIPNTNVQSDRWFAWLFYFFVEGYSPFVVSVFWSFANSINSPESARHTYGTMVSWSKLGGIVATGLALIFLKFHATGQNQLGVDLFNHQVLLVGSSLLLLVTIPVLYYMMRVIPGRYLHGYEAVYVVEKEKDRNHSSDTTIFAGLRMLILYPYVFGIFAMSFFYEVITVVLSYLVVSMSQAYGSMTASLEYLLGVILVTHTIGMCISYFGTRTLFNKLGTKRCLLLIPASSGIVLCYYLISSSPATALALTFVILRAINYAFSWPLRESLYIPTVKEIKFKSKSWIDAFGSKFAKSTGSGFNHIAAHKVAPALFMPLHTAFFAGIVGVWFLAAYLLGRRFDKAVARNEVIGATNDHGHEKA